MTKNDRATAGALSGIAGGLVQEIYGHTAKYLGLTEKTFVDFAQIMVTYNKFRGPVATLVEWMAHLTVGAFLGILFALIFRYTSSKYWWFKGVVYGSILWFLFTGLGTVFKIKGFQIVDPSSAISIWIGSVIYGLVAGYTLKYLDSKTTLV